MPTSIREMLDLPPLITVEQAAELVGGMARSTAYRRVRDGDWPVIREGGRLRVQLIPFARSVLGVDLIEPKQEMRGLMSVTETASYLGIGEKLVRTAIEDGDCPSVKWGRRVFVPKYALDRLLRGDPIDREAVPS